MDIPNCSIALAGRSREGAWIEICASQESTRASSRSREGAWIEISMASGKT